MNSYNKQKQIRRWLSDHSQFFFIPVAHAQGFGLTPETDPLIGGDERALLLVILRYILVVTLLIVGIIGFRAGFDWYFFDGDATERKEAKVTLSKAFIWATILFFLITMFRVFIPDYSQLGL